MSSLSTLIHDAIKSGDIDTVYGIIDDQYSKNSKNPCVFDQVGYMTRITFVNEASWAIPDIEAIETIADFIGDKIALEVGAGNALWAALLKNQFQEKGLNGTIIATDDFSWPNQYNCYTEVENLKAEDAVNERPETDVLILIWPPYSKPMAFESLKSFKGDYVVYIGEGEGGCTGDDNFHQCLSDEWENTNGHCIRQWSGINDYISFYIRKKD